MSEDRWATEYPSMYAFQNFHKFVGDLYVLDPTLTFVKAASVSGLWYQYFDSAGTLWGETYIKGLPGVPAEVLVRASKNTLVPIPRTNRVCQNFTEDSGPAYVYEYPYSEVNPNGVGYSNSAYYYTRPEMLGRVGSGEMFSWDMEWSSAFALIVSINQGVGHAQHNPGFIAYFRYQPTTLTEAMAMGFVATPQVATSTKLIKAGLLQIPIEVLPENVRSRVAL